MSELEFLDSYDGQTVEELISMEKTHRIDSLVLAFEEVLDRKSYKLGSAELSETENIILAVEALEREVNNGGYHQFFGNSSKEYAPAIVCALRKISCPKTADITQKAIDSLGVNGPLTVSAIDEVMQRDDNGQLSEILSELDDAYYNTGESIGNRLFEYIKINKNQIKF